ncbi:MAG TPA: HD domain-containing phosphohydrolase [Candidatus Omnitrophota bacterium]|nr:HD domain-containing phosphohydrolase [Candidatus Omnitrophota bacterium]HQQ05370.1 HD domain-containing phosphohydrolase [Candidatus Omnitrophota bacterium]
MKARPHMIKRDRRRTGAQRKLFKRFSDLAAKLKRTLRHRDFIRQELASREAELRHIFKLNASLISVIPCDQMYGMVTRIAHGLLDTDIVVLRLFDEAKNALCVVSSYFTGSDMIRELPDIKIGDAVSGRAFQTGKAISVADIDKHPVVRKMKLVRIIRKEGARSILSVPILFQGKPLGVIATYCRRPRVFTSKEINLMRVFASYVATILREAEHHRQMHLTYFNTISSLVLTLETRDPYTQGHTERVTKFALLIGKAMGLPAADMNILHYAAEIHDIGKISIPDFILNKPSSLNKLERRMIELHPVKGAQILGPLEFLKQVIPIVRHHHERFDGTGYPDRLKGIRIPLLARILACADSYDAMTSERPYKARMSVPEAVREIRRNAGTQFDPKIAALFIRLIQKNPSL